MRAAVLALRQLGPKRIVVAVPVGAAETCAAFESEADEAICATMPDPFYAVGYWYANFQATTDDEVRALLAEAREELAARAES
jgi:predicted phosphoribosyltransferase